MKIMKQISALLLGIIMVLSLAACSQSEKVVVLRGDMTAEMSGIPTIDTWTLTAKGDTVKTVKEVFELDLSEYDDETIKALTSSFESLMVEPAKKIDGVECTAQMKGNTYVIELTVNCSGDAVKKAAEADLLTIDGTSDRISLKQTQSSLEKQGYKVVE